MHRTPLILTMALLCSALWACTDSKPASDSDGGALSPDSKLLPDAPKGPPERLHCPQGACRSYVFKRLFLPTEQGDAELLGVDHDGDGEADNGFGALLVKLEADLAPHLSLQDSVDLATYSGLAPLIIDVAPPSLAPGAIAAQLLVAQPQACCAGDEDSVFSCGVKSKFSCFAAKRTTFHLSDDSPRRGTLEGSVDAKKKLSLAADSLPLRLTFALRPGNQASKDGGPPPKTAVSVDLGLSQARINGRITDEFLGSVGLFKKQSVVLSGVIDPKELREGLAPALAEVLSALLAREDTSAATKTELLARFDKAPADGLITSEDLVAHPALVGLEGDVDVDSDGQRELSFGIGFDAVLTTLE